MEIKFVGDLGSIVREMKSYLGSFGEAVSIPALEKPAKAQKGFALTEKRGPGRPPFKKQSDIASAVLTSPANTTTVVEPFSLVGAVGVEPTTSNDTLGFEPAVLSSTPVHSEKISQKSEITKEVLTEAFKQLCEKTNGVQKFREILTEFNFKRLGEVTPEFYGPMFERINDNH